MASLFKRRETRPATVQGQPDPAGPASPIPAPPEPAAADEVAAQAAPPDPDGIEGYIDLIDGERVVGWAYDAAVPGRRLLIEISAGDTVEVVLANLERHDLRDAGKGDGRHGFEARIDLAAAGADLVHVRIVATGRELGGSPARTGLIQLVAHAEGGQLLECLKSEAQLALLSLKGIGTR